jgi:hypothetical protein
LRVECAQLHLQSRQIETKLPTAVENTISQVTDARIAALDRPAVPPNNVVSPFHWTANQGTSCILLLFLKGIPPSKLNKETFMNSEIKYLAPFGVGEGDAWHHFGLILSLVSDSLKSLR